jgi:glycosyltransferase involved in cell wall biosynthesis
METPVAVLLPTDEVGGHEQMLLEWLSQARSAGLRPTIYCRDGWELAERAREYGFPCQDPGYVVHREGLLCLARWRNFIRTWRVAARMRRCGTAVLLAPGTVQAVPLHFLACQIARVAVACYVPMAHDALTQRGSFPKLRDWLCAGLSAKIAMWITVSSRQEMLLREYWGVRAPIFVIPNRLDILARPPASTRRAEGERSGLRVLYAGRFDANQKGLDWLAEVIASAPSWMEGMTFLFQGRGHFSSRLEALARGAGPDRVQVLPWGRIAETLERAEVLVLPSRFEGVPLVAIEAIWHGVPVVASWESGLGDFLAEECLFPFGNDAALQQALERMRSGPRREAAVAHARDKMAEYLSENSYRAALQDVIARIRTLATPASARAIA